MARFRDLIAREHELLARGEDNSTVVREPNASGEPRVDATGNDLCGLALSGGGIRSATFNLGVLQAMARFDLLRHVDYLATVSGGGYIGGWWSAWRRRSTAAAIFPDGDDAEYELRHLREFSKYLAPRWSIAELESWLFVAAITAMMLPSLLGTFALVGATFLLFGLLCDLVVFAPDGGTRSIGIGVLTLVVLIVYDQQWRRRAQPELGNSGRNAFHALTVVASAAVAGGALLLPVAAFPSRSMFDATDDALVGLLPELFRPTWCWLAAYGGMAGLRYVLTRAGASIPSMTLRGALDRVLARLVGLATAWSVLSLLWQGGQWLASHPPFSIAAEPLVIGMILVVMWLWRVSKVPPNIPRTQSAWQRLRNGIPLLVAYATLILALVGIASLLVRAHRDLEMSVAMLLTITLGGVLLTVVLFDPAEAGLHAGFRSRVTRAYLGSWPIRTAHKLEPNRAVDPQPSDDFWVTDLRRVGRPLHLVCCAANDLSGDPLSNLNRGARSATLSTLGLAIGDSFVPWAGRGPTFGSLLTASAATINPIMGTASVRTGPIVRFIATALNLRLGLWLPAVTQRGLSALVERWLPGRLFYAELLGLTRADLSRNVLLSDGCYFDNTGLYELVRRRCRFIILCDCGEDADMAFDDVGNALRKVRQDLDVDIRIDLDPLRGGDDGCSRQHVAVGQIEYGPDDLGTLIVLKPSLTGDEPVDVQQYRARNRSFPHESTGNQFYDAAQWESYRRLGYHAALSAFAVVTRLSGERSAAQVFAALRARWYPTPADLAPTLLRLTQRFSEFEDSVRESSPLFFRLEMYPELREIVGAGDSKEPSAEEWQQVLTLLLRFTQLMEDVWIGCRLETHWSHPLNSGWMSYFHRGTSTPSFKMWWPILRPLFSKGLRHFARERFGLPSPGDDIVGPGSDRPFGEVMPLTDGFGQRLASRAWLDAGFARPREGERVYRYVLHLRPDAERDYPLEAGLVVLSTARTADGPVARWKSWQLFTAPSLRGAGLERAFLHELLRRLGAEGIAVVRVELPEQDETDAAASRARQDLVEFYTRESFRRDPDGRNILMLRIQAPPEGGHLEAGNRLDVDEGSAAGDGLGVGDELEVDGVIAADDIPRRRRARARRRRKPG